MLSPKKVEMIELCLGSAVVTGALTKEDLDEVSKLLSHKGLSEKSYMSVSDCASRLGVHPLTIKRYIKASKLAAVRLGRDYRISESSLSDFLAKGR